MKTIIFDENSYKWSRNLDANSGLLDQLLTWLGHSLNAYGYLYLNQIYETLGVAWNPDNENICYRKENGPIKFQKIGVCSNAYRINITQ